MSRSILPVVAIVGRPNVGKSTLFNRIAGKRLAIVENVPGVTRDRNYVEAEHEGRPFLLVDTGGFEPDDPDRLIQQVKEQATLAIDEAEAVLFVVDGVEGPARADIEIAEMLRRSGKAVFVVVNKIDSPKRELEGFLSEYFTLGFSRVFPISAEHARGIDDLLDSVVALLPEPLPEEEEEELFPAEALEEGSEAAAEAEARLEEKARKEREERPIRIGIVGRPNVGKSTLINRLVGEERLVTSPIAGTTRDVVDTELEFEGRRIILTDTAGIRRKRSIALRVEAYSVVRAVRAIEASDVIVVILDAEEPAVEQDAKIAGLAEEQGKALIVLVNKWDRIAGDAKKEAAFREDILWRMPFLAYAPIRYASALTGERVEDVLREAVALFDQYTSRVPTPQLNRLLQEISEHHSLPVVGGKRARLYYIAQVGTRPPTFVVQTNRPELVPPDYRRYVSNRIRDVFGFRIPLRLIFRRKASQRSRTPEKRPGSRGTKRGMKAATRGRGQHRRR